MCIVLFVLGWHPIFHTFFSYADICWLIWIDVDVYRNFWYQKEGFSMSFDCSFTTIVSINGYRQKNGLWFCRPTLTSHILRCYAVASKMYLHNILQFFTRRNCLYLIKCFHVDLFSATFFPQWTIRLVTFCLASVTHYRHSVLITKNLLHWKQFI